MGFFDFLGGVKRQVDIFDNGKTFKNKEGNKQDTRSTGTQVKDAGFSFLKSVAHPFAEFGNAAAHVPQAVYREVQNKPIGDIQQKVFGTTDSGKIAKKIIGDTAQIGLTVAAPGIGRAAETGATAAVGAVAPGVAEDAIKMAALKSALGVGGEVLPRGVDTAIGLTAAPIAGATVGAPFNVASDVSSGKNMTKEELLKSAVTGGLFGAGLGFAGEAAGVGAKAIKANGPLGEEGFIGRGLSQDELKRLKAADNVKDVEKVLSDIMPKQEIDKIAPTIVEAKDTNVIRNLINNRTALSAEDHPALQPSTPVVSDIIPAGKGALPTEVNRGATLSTADMPKIASPETPPATPNVTAAPAEAVKPQQIVMDALNGKPAAPGQSPVTGVRNLSQQQKTILSQERGQRFGAAGSASEGLSGTEAHIAELKQLKGKYSKVEWNGLQDQLGGPDAAEQVYSQLRDQVKSNKTLSYTDGLNTDIALRKLVLGEGLPTAGDIKRLENVFGPQEIDQIASHVSKFTQAKDLGKQLLGVPRALMASGDVSFGGRQALAYATAHPIEFAKQWTKQFKYFKEGLKSNDAEALTKSFQEIKSHPDYELAKKAGLAITDVVGHNPSTREEQFISGNLAEKIPLAGRLVRGSDHAFTGLANNIRANSFYSLIDQARSAGYNVDENFAKQVARVVNNGTGRGSLKGLENHMGTLSTTLFAPRLMLSRLNTLFNPAYYIKTNPVARKEALRQLLGLSAFATGVLGIAKGAGLKIGTDPTNADFGKVKVGDTRLDFLGGYQQYIKLVAQITEGKTTSSMTGKESKLGSGFGKKNVKDILYSFLENKENPVASFVTGLAKGTDITGNSTRSPKAIGSGVVQRMVPLLIQDLNDLRTHPNSSKNIGLDIAAPLLGAGGAGIQTYGTSDIQLTGKTKEYIDKLKSSGADQNQIKASTDFFQLSKTGPDRNQYADRIKEALKAGDENKAVQLAKQYNDEYSSLFDDWRKKYGQYRNDKALVKEYTSNRITGNSLLRWYDSIKQESQP